MKKSRRIYLALTWLVLIISPFPLIIILNRGLIDTPGHLLAYDMGVVAYVWWLMIVLMSTRPHWMTQKVGMPALYAIHGALGVMALIAATIHRFTSFSMFPLIKQTGNIAWYLEIFLLAYAVLFLSGWLVDRLRKLNSLKLWVEHHFLNHQVTMWIHRLNFVVIALIWVHVHVIPRLGLVTGFRLTFDIYTGITVILYCWWKLKIGRYHSVAKVKKNISLGPLMQELTLQFENDNESYQAGDFYFLSFKNVKGVSTEPHPFSVASAPRTQPHEVSFMIHRLGDFTRKIANVPMGTEVKLEGPFGLFNREVKNNEAPLILYGLGSGVAPLINLAQQYAGIKQLHLIWSGPQVDNPYYQEILAELKKKGVKVDAQVHRFTSKDLIRIISSNELKKASVIIVGSAARILYVRRKLRKLGFAKDRLMDERMTM
ncbi:MAG: hypothetical protein SOW93_03255 [Limosilactobacillus reuteri]|nr:hypothetical protein [Limosilactobacillus reuteri]